MKRIKIFVQFLLMIVLFTGCSFIEDFTVPSKLKFKASPKYCISIGEIDYDLESNSISSGNWNKPLEGGGFFSKEDKIIKPLKQSGFDVYEYNPDNSYPDELQLLMKKNIAEININFSEMLKETGLNDFADMASFDEKIEIPAIEYNDNVKIDLSSVQDRLNKLIHIAGTTAGGDISVNAEDNSEGNFTSMSYQSGYLVITTTKSFVKDETVSISYGGKVVLTGKMNGDVCKLDLSGKTLYKTGMSIAFSPEKNSNVQYEGLIEDGSIVSVAEGLTISDLSIPFEDELDTQKSFDSFSSCTVADGDLYIDLDVDSSWKGYSIKYPVSLSGGINGKSKTYGSREVVSLNDSTIVPEKTKINAGVKIDFKNGTFVYDKVPSLVVSSDIRKLAEIITSVDDIKLDQENSVSIDKALKMIDCGKSVIKCNYVNMLPAGNDPIKINFVSKFLGFDDIKPMEANHSAGTIKFVASKDSKISKLTENPVEEDEFSGIDFVTHVNLPGSTKENPEQIILRNVVPSTSYSISFNIDKNDEKAMDIKWNKIILDAEGFSQAGTQDTNFNPSSLLGSIKDYFKTVDGKDSSIKLASIPFYLYCTTPDTAAFKGSKIEGKLKLTTSDKMLSDEGDYLAGSSTEYKVMDFSKAPDYSQQNEDGVLISDISAVTPSYSTDLAYYINKIKDSEASLVIDYDFKFVNGKSKESEITITPDDIKGDEAQKLLISVVLVLPFRVGFEEPVVMDIMKLAEFKDDLLGRTEPSSTEEYEEFLKYLESAKINLNMRRIPFTSSDLELVVNLYGSDKKYQDKKKSVSLAVGENVSLGVSDAAELVKVYPLVPSVYLSLPSVESDSGWVSIGRNFKFGASIGLEIQTDAEYTFNWR